MSKVRWSTAMFFAAAGVACAILSGCGTGVHPGDNKPTGLFEQLVTGSTGTGLPPKDDSGHSSHANRSHAPGKFRSYPGSDQYMDASSGPGSTRVNGGYQLNFNNVDLAQFANVVLRDTLKVPYVFDTKVNGKVTVSTGRPVSREQVLVILETVLQMNRAVLIHNGGQYTVTGIANAQASTVTSVDYAAERREVGPGYGVTFYSLQHASAASIHRMLASFVAKPGSLRAEFNRNLLIIRGTSRERATLVDVAATFDVDWLQGQSTGIFRLDHATPLDMIGELDEIFANGRDGAGAGLVKFLPIERLNAILVLTKQEAILEKVETWVRRLDRTDPAALGLHVYEVENGKAAHLAKLLNSMFGSRGANESLQSASAERTVVPGDVPSRTSFNTAATPGGGAPAPIPAPPPGGNGRLAFSSQIGADTISRTVDQPPPAQSAPNGVAITPDDANNKLLIRATGHDYRKMLKILHRIDVPPRQVMINATLAEVTLNHNLRYGVQVFLKSQKGILGFSNGSLLEIQPVLPGLNAIAGSLPSPKVILDALSAKTDVRLVSSPSVVVVNNESATLQIGDDVPVVIGRSQSVTNPDAAIVNDIQYRKTGVILHVKPQINSDGLVKLQVEQEISNVVRTQAAAQNSGTVSTPTISQRRVVSTISVYSGQMVVLAGLMSERRDRAKNRVPLLERVPFLGDVIGKTDGTTVRTELVIFIQPHVINDPADATLLTSELKARLRTLTPAFNVREWKEQRREREHIDDRSWGSKVSHK